MRYINGVHGPLPRRCGMTLPVLPVDDADGKHGSSLTAKLLGPFSLTLGRRRAGPWARPSGRRLWELVLVSPGSRIGRQAACEALFPNLPPGAAASSLRKALFMARQAVVPLGVDGARALLADRASIWAQDGVEIDFVAHQQALRSVLSMSPGPARDARLEEALGEERALLEDEPYADWAVGPRDHLEALRQEARLVLARDRARGFGRSRHADICHAWEACLAHDPTSEEAASALVRAYAAEGRHALAAATYRRCHEALEGLGLRASPALEEANVASAAAAPGRATTGPIGHGEERRLVSVVFVELNGPVGTGEKLGPEELHDLVGGALAELVAQVEALGGTVTSVSGTGVVALFGAPEAHEDDPERALRAAFRCLSGAGGHGPAMTLRAGVETGHAVVGPIGGSHYGALGEVVSAAAALQAVSKSSSVLVGPATRAATEGLFEWGPAEELATSPGGKPVVASYLTRPKARPVGQAGRRSLASSVALVGRDHEVSVLREALRELTVGKGGVVLLTAGPGLGKSRLVQEFRKLFMAWAGAASGRLPLWLEGHAASYASATPYGLYRQLLSAWVGSGPEQGEDEARVALERAMRAAFAGKVDGDRLGLLSRMMGLEAARSGHVGSRFGPEQLQRATFDAVLALVSRLVAHGPTALVLEDLHWADPTSLRLTEELSRLTEQAPLLLLLSTRPEPGPGVASLRAVLGRAAGLRLRRLELAPLPSDAEHELASALLGGAADEVVAAASLGAEGNPLFLEERLASLLETHALTKGPSGGWHLEHGAPQELPGAIERLVRSRVDRLGPGPREAVVAASVLGPDFDLGALRTVTDLGDSLVPAVRELCSSGLLVALRGLAEPVYRFRHALIQEATYESLLKTQRRHLHARAAWGLEEVAAGRLEEVAGVLGHHYAMAGEARPAARYLELAGDRAAAAFANDEAVASYRRALELLEGDDLGAQAAEVSLKLGRLFWWLGRYGEGRAALQEAVRLVPSADPVLSARCYQRLGQVEAEDCRWDEALTALGTAQDLLEGCRDEAREDWVETWLDVQFSRCGVYSAGNESELHAEVLSATRPFVEARGLPRHKADFYGHLASQRWRANGFRVDQDVLALKRTAWETAVEAGLADELNNARFFLGSMLLRHGDLADAQAELEGSLGVARMAGDRSLELKCLDLLSYACLRQHDVAATRQLATEGERLERAYGLRSFGAREATLAWVAWKEGHLSEASRLAEEARDRWRPWVTMVPRWIYLWPLIGAELSAGHGEEAMVTARELLTRPQERMPDELEATVQSAISAWDDGQQALASERLARALDLADELHFV